MSLLKSWQSSIRPTIYKIHAFIVRMLASKWFFVATITLFIISSGWIALSTSFPLIFDENYHLGVIDIYSRESSPFISSQPDEAKYYGDITRNPSYLYWYLFSFLYSFVGWFTDDIINIIISLRFINIALVAVSLYFWRKVVFNLGLNRAAAHLTLFIFTMVPLVPYVAAHINYDNLVLLLMPLLLLAVMKLRTTNQPLMYLAAAAGTAGVLSVVKFSMLPVVMVSAITALVVLLLRYKKEVISQVMASAKQSKKGLLIGSLVLAVTGLGLFTERYGANYVQYGTHTPDCIQIHDFDTCKEYSVWIRNYNAERRTPPLSERNIVPPHEFTATWWAPNIYQGLYVSAAFKDASTDVHQFMPQELTATGGSWLAHITGAALLIIGFIALAITWRKLPEKTNRYFMLAGFLVYAGAVWVTNYSNYLTLGYPYAMQGRYFIPFIIPVVGLMVLSYHYLTKRLPAIRILLLLTLLIGFIGAAGALTYIIYGNNSWQWDFGPFKEWNTALRQFLLTFIPKF